MGKEIRVEGREGNKMNGRIYTPAKRLDKSKQSTGRIINISLNSARNYKYY